MVYQDPGRALNPSIQEILAGIQGAPGEEVIVLPNSPNVVMAAFAHDPRVRYVGKPIHFNELLRALDAA